MTEHEITKETTKLAEGETIETGPKSKRYYSLDAVRATALLLGLVYHTALTFTGAYDHYPIQNIEPDIFLTFTIYFLHLFRMETFFIIAGFFSYMLYQKRGWKTFFSDRFKRIFLPMLVFLPFTFFIMLFSFRLYEEIGDSSIVNLGDIGDELKESFDVPVLHLWFLQFLCIFYLVFMPIISICSKYLNTNKIKQAISSATSLLSKPFGTIVFSLVTATFLYAYPHWMGWFGIPTSINHIPDWHVLAIYSPPFILGLLLYRSPEFLQNFPKYWLMNLILGLIGTFIPLFLLGFSANDQSLAGDLILKSYIALGISLGGWGISFAFLGIFIRYLDYEDKRWRYISDSSYWVYLLHFPIIFALQTLSNPIQLPPIVKFALILSITTFICFGSYHYFVRATIIGAWLNGRKHPL